MKKLNKNPLSMAFAKLYIKDILELDGKEMFQYNGHVICKVDIFGIVVKVIEKHKFFLYGVDDGTGVINCCCWKPDPEPQPDLVKGEGESLSIDDFLKLKISDDLVDQITPIELGESIHVRGKIKRYRGDIQVSSCFFEKVDDPRCEKVIERMLELPRLYREVYDQQFVLKKPDTVKSKLSPVLESLIEAVKLFLENSATNSFYICELETVPQLTAITQNLNLSHAVGKQSSAITSDNKKMQSDSVNPAFCSSASSSSSTGVSLPSLNQNKSTNSDKYSEMCSTIATRTIFKDAVHQLEQRGLVYKSDSDTNLYYVLHNKMSITKEVLKTLKDICSKSKNLKGCHYLHLLKNMQQSKTFSKVTERTILKVLQELEENSDIISTTNEHYIPFKM